MKTPTVENKLNKSVQQAEIKLAGYIAEHNIPFLASDHLTDLLKDIFHDSGIIFFSIYFIIHFMLTYFYNNWIF